MSLVAWVLAETIIDDVIDGGVGGTYTKEGFLVEPTTGYWTAVHDETEIIPLLSILNNEPYVSKQRLYLWLNTRLDTAEYVGYWVEDNLLYVDLVGWYDNLGEALGVAESFNQLAIWDIANNVSVYV